MNFHVKVFRGDAGSQIGKPPIRIGGGILSNSGEDFEERATGTLIIGADVLECQLSMSPKGNLYSLLGALSEAELFKDEDGDYAG